MDNKSDNKSEEKKKKHKVVGVIRFKSALQDPRDYASMLEELEKALNILSDEGYRVDSIAPVRAKSLTGFRILASYDTVREVISDLVDSLPKPEKTSGQKMSPASREFLELVAEKTGGVFTDTGRLRRAIHDVCKTQSSAVLRQLEDEYEYQCEEHKKHSGCEYLPILQALTEEIRRYRQIYSS